MTGEGGSARVVFKRGTGAPVQRADYRSHRLGRLATFIALDSRLSSRRFAFLRRSNQRIGRRRRHGEAAGGEDAPPGRLRRKPPPPQK
jgi:hypothetical protein